MVEGKSIFAQIQSKDIGCSSRCDSACISGCNSTGLCGLVPFMRLYALILKIAINASSDDWDGLKCKLWEVLRFCDIPNCARDYLYEVQPFRERLPSVELRIPTREKCTVRSQNKRSLDGFTRQTVIYSNQQKAGRWRVWQNKAMS